MKTVFAILILAWLPHADASDCEFTSREKLPALFSQMPPAVRGLVNCSQSNHDANVFVVSKLAKLDEPNFAAYIQIFARMIDFDATRGSITWQSPQPLAQRQALVKTSSKSGTMQHYVFVAHGSIFIHSMDERESQRIRNSLDDLNKKISATPL